MPEHDASSPSKFQVYLSTYLLESLSATTLKTNTIDFWTHSSSIPKDFPIQLNTSFLGEIIPGLLKKYGPNKTVDLEYQLDKVGNFSVKQANETISLDGSVSVKFWVNTAPG